MESKHDGARGLPLTSAQMLFWLAQERDPRSPAFLCAEYVELLGPVDVGLLEQALRRTLAEAEATRVRFRTTADGDVRQVVQALDGWTLPVHDLRAEAEPERAADDWMAAHGHPSFDLEHDHAFAFTVLRTGDERFLFHLVMHHILLDGYGFSLFLHRTAAVYTALSAGQDVPPCPFGTLEDAVADDLAYRTSDLMARDREYWRGQLADWIDESGPAHRPDEVSYTFVRETGHLDPEAAAGLRALARTARTGLATAAIAALGLYVHRLGGSDDLGLQLTVSGRSPASRTVPAVLANVLPLRLRTTPETTVADLLRHTADQAKGLLRHQRYPYLHLERELHVRHNRPGPLGSWGVNVMTYDGDVCFGEIPAVIHNLSNGPVAGWAVNVYDRPSDGSLRIDLQADPDHCSAAEVAAHHRRFLHLLRTLATADPALPVGDLDLLTAAERTHVLAAGRGPDRPAPTATLPELFQEQARRAPRARALVCGAKELTAAELNGRANRLAHLLLARGAAPETYVAVALPRTEDYIVGLLAVLKTGAGCVALDPEHPDARTELMLDDTRPLCVLTTAEPTTAAEGPAVLCLDDPETERALALQPETDPTDQDRAHPLAPHHPAYVNFTSGTSGRPNGVVVEHRQLAQLFADHEAELIRPAATAAGRPLRAALTASFTFDTSWEGLLFLAAGQELHLIEESVRRDPAALVAHVREQQLDFLDITPSYLRQLLTAGLLADGAHRPGPLMVGGEALDADLWQRLRESPGTAAYNYYGPTECTVDAVYCRLDEQGDRPVIGRPGHNTQAYVLDRAGQPTPPGVPGELHLGGAQVARGYLNRPELTRQRFLPDPYGPPGARMYRTGDAARWTEDGVLEYLGRTDEQVKVHGVRIEPGEIEAVLAGHPHLAQAAVTVHTAERGEHTLTAHVVTGSERAADAASLRAWAAERLPAAMVPAAVLCHTALPLTAHGKLDRAALAAAHAATPRASSTRRSPRDAREQDLCALFAEVLDLPADGVGIDDDFFALGGHSLKAAQLAARISARLGVEVPPAALYRAPTVAALTELAEQTREGGRLPDAFGPLLTLRPGDGGPPVFCLHPSGGLGWCYATLPRHLPADVPVYVLQARGLRGAEQVPGSFPEMIDDYVRQIRSVQTTGPYRLLGWSLGGSLAHAAAVRLQAEGERVELLAMLDAQPIDPDEARRIEADPELTRTLVLEAAGRIPIPAQATGPAHAPDGTRLLAELQAELADEHLVAALDVLAHQASLAPTYHPEVFDGDLVYFHASRGKPSGAPAGQAWRPWITGSITSYDNDCTHHTMMQPDHIAPIGKVIAARISAE
ncbi:amino acid adenylation domain-containing protein [Streptomyces cavernicola]|uniref:Amino acid adenylation domain-containing protein n=1 Tax=Streptomyces cavernicola TaxID=3043613 RepID=A0ABT6SCD2_9ACTN|nr:amino acid adenylation domain-containing protein [Streptomyces sp. B-S-A6]MDI3405128.1 amino acid adenylation domain-containing protein [Streptomyces sp. B-S-A6]